LSKPLFVVYEDVDMKDIAEKILGHMAQKPVEALQSGKESRGIKRVKSLSNLAGKPNYGSKK
jgi:hypothetical protein